MAFDRHAAIQAAVLLDETLEAYVNRYGEMTDEELEQYATVEAEIVADEETGFDNEDARVQSPSQEQESGPVSESDEQG
jgi:hypothetical protein